MVLTFVDTEPVEFIELPCDNGRKIGIACLNVESRLNALSLDLIRKLDARLRVWARDDEIVCVLIRGSGERAFCAGGDVRDVRAAIVASPELPVNPTALAFFCEEYSLDFLVHRFPKPILVWGTGIVFGGGLGLFEGASHRVVTEASQLAMPELAIGFFPDVGANWFLRRMPLGLGLFFSLTGLSLNAHDALRTGLAEYFVLSSHWDRFTAYLKNVRWSSDPQQDREALSERLILFNNEARYLLPPSNIAGLEEKINDLVTGCDLNEIVAKILAEARFPLMKRASKMIQRGSPTSVALSWELWKRTRSFTLADVLRLDLTVAMQCCRRHDFLEGVRATLIDKDRKPVWRPQSFDALPPEWIEGHFTSLWSDSEHPLRDLETVWA